MLLFMDGWDHYATANLLTKYNSVGANIAIGSVGRDGGGALTTDPIGATSTSNVTKTLAAASSSLVVGFRFKMSALFASARTIFQFLDTGTVQCSLILNMDGTLSVVRGTTTALTNGTSVAALSAGEYNYIEFKVTIADSISAGSCKVRINGVDVITVATGQDTKTTANATANGYLLGTTASATVISFDDFYICDLSGTDNNDFRGDSRVDLLLPNADGTYSQFTPSAGTSHFALVDEATPNTTDYNDGTAVGDRDSYGLGNLAALASQTVYGVQVNAAVLKDDAGAKSVATMVRSGTTNADGASTPLGTSQVYVSQVFELNPSGSVAWTETTVNAMEAGVTVTA